MNSITKFPAQIVILLQLNCRWDVDIKTVSCSETVKIIFSAIHSTVCEIGERSVKRQGRNVKNDVIKIVRHFFLFVPAFYFDF